MATIEIAPLINRATGLDPITQFVRSLPGEHYLLREVAIFLEVSGRTLRRLMRQSPEELGPSHSVLMGRVKIYLYSPADVLRLHAYFADRTRLLPPDSHPTGGNAGRPVLWTAVEYHERQRRHSRASYWRNRAAQLEARGDTESAGEALAKAEQIRAELRDQYDARAAVVYGYSG